MINNINRASPFYNIGKLMFLSTFLFFCFLQQGNDGSFAFLSNLLYKKTQMARVFTWHVPASSRESCLPAEKKDITKSQAVFTLKTAVNIFPDKTRDLQGATLNVSNRNIY